MTRVYAISNDPAINDSETPKDDDVVISRTSHGELTSGTTITTYLNVPTQEEGCTATGALLPVKHGQNEEIPLSGMK